MSQLEDAQTEAVTALDEAIETSAGEDMNIVDSAAEDPAEDMVSNEQTPDDIEPAPEPEEIVPEKDHTSSESEDSSSESEKSSSSESEHSSSEDEETEQTVVGEEQKMTGSEQMSNENSQQVTEDGQKMDVDKHKTDVDEHKTDVDEHKTDVDEHKTDVDEHKTNEENEMSQSQPAANLEEMVTVAKDVTAEHTEIVDEVRSQDSPNVVGEEKNDDDRTSDDAAVESKAKPENPDQTSTKDSSDVEVGDSTSQRPAMEPDVSVVKDSSSESSDEGNASESEKEGKKEEKKGEKSPQPTGNDTVPAAAVGAAAVGAAAVGAAAVVVTTESSQTAAPTPEAKAADGAVSSKVETTPATDKPATDAKVKQKQASVETEEKPVEATVTYKSESAKMVPQSVEKEPAVQITTSTDAKSDEKPKEEYPEFPVPGDGGRGKEPPAEVRREQRLPPPVTSPGKQEECNASVSLY